MGFAEVFRTLRLTEDAARRLAARLTAEGIPFALGGDFALEAQHCPIFANLIELLTTKEGWASVESRLVGSGYTRVNERYGQLRDDSSEHLIEVVVGNLHVTLSEDGTPMIPLPKLIELRLISGTTNPRWRRQDLGDVQRLIAYKLPREIGAEIDASVRDEYYRMWDAAQNAWDPSNE